MPDLKAAPKPSIGPSVSGFMPLGAEGLFASWACRAANAPSLLGPVILNWRPSGPVILYVGIPSLSKVYPSLRWCNQLD